MCVNGAPLVCDDGDPCTGLESCDPLMGCLAGTALVCDDGRDCSVDRCDAALGCQHDASACACDSDADCTDADACNGVETCDFATGLCGRDGPLECDDGDACNGEETCDAATGCVVGTALVCDDGDPCTTDGCEDGACAVTAVLPGCCAGDDDCDAPRERCVAADNACVTVLCAVCENDADCGQAGNLCVDLVSGPHCGVQCSPGGAACPEDAVCAPTETGEYQCLPQAGDCACIASARTACQDGDLYWWSSCGEREELAEDCGGRGCANGACLSETAEPVAEPVAEPGIVEPARDAGSAEVLGPDAGKRDGIGRDLPLDGIPMPDRGQGGGDATVADGGGGGGSSSSGCSAAGGRSSWLAVLPLLLALGVPAFRLRRRSKNQSRA